MLIGRGEELDVLVGRLRETAAVAVVGEAGIGKTALLRAACAKAEIDALVGGGLELLSAVAYLPLARALGEAPPGDDEATAAEFVIEALDGRALVLDDLHWADADTLSVLPLLAGRVPVLTAVRRGAPGALRVSAMLDEAGFEAVELKPIDSASSRQVLQTVEPGLSTEAIEEILGHACGNPLLLEELAKGDASEPTLQLSLLTRLDAHSAAAKRCAARSALLRRPAGRDLLGDAVDELLEAGLMIEAPEGLSLRHALLGEAVVGGLSDSERRRAHSELAGALDDSGEAAHHHFAAGETKDAHSRAMEAVEFATRPAERAAHLTVAANSAEAGDGDRLRLRAASALNEAGQYEPARELLAAIVDESPGTRAALALEEGRAIAAAGQVDEAHRRFQAGLGAIENTGSELEVRLLLALATNRQQAEWGSVDALEWSERAWRQARGTGIGTDEAEYVYAVSLYVCGQREKAIEHARKALSLVRLGEDRALEFKVSFLLSAILSASRRPREARDLLSTVVERARELDLLTWERHARSLTAYVECLQLGEYAKTTTELEDLLQHPLSLGPHLDEMRYTYAVGLADTGRIAEARQFATAALEQPTGETGRALLLTTLAEIEWLAQKPEQALSFSEDALAVETESPNRLLAELTRRWALFETGRKPEPVVTETGFPADASVRLESEAIALMLDPGAATRAAERFLEASRAWHLVELRGQYRCLWACGEALLLSGDKAGAKSVLLDAELRSEEVGLVPLLRRIRLALRRAGLHRSATRGEGVGTLTHREHEAMTLVGAGLASADVAAQMGIARSTVESHVRSAMAKLGTRNRRQAAALALAVEPE